MRKTLAAYVLIAIGLTCLLLAWLINIGQPASLRTHSVDVDSAPSVVRPSAPVVAKYTVAPGLPKYITIPAIGIDETRVIGLGLKKNGQIATPDNIYDTGWYKNSAEPGKPGAMFIYGHVSNWTAEGVFYNLKQLKPGDTITITSGEDKSYTYRVTTTKVYAYKNVDMPAVLSPIKPGKPGLNLMTCTGKIIKGTSQFDERLVVFASQE